MSHRLSRIGAWQTNQRAVRFEMQCEYDIFLLIEGINVSTQNHSKQNLSQNIFLQIYHDFLHSFVFLFTQRYYDTCCYWGLLNHSITRHGIFLLRFLSLSNHPLDLSAFISTVNIHIDCLTLHLIRQFRKRCCWSKLHLNKRFLSSWHGQSQSDDLLDVNFGNYTANLPRW